MKITTLIKRSLFYYRRTNLGVVLGAAVGTGILTGALLVGDSVDFSLKKLARSRLGQTHLALTTPNNFFRAELADDLQKVLKTNIAAVMNLKGILINPATEARCNQVEVFGVDERFWQLDSGKNPLPEPADEIVLNQPLAARLGVKPADEVVLRVAQPSLLSREAPLSPDQDLAVAARMTVRAMVGESQLGRFNLQANQVAPLNAFVSRKWLTDKVGLAGKADMLLVGKGENKISADSANETLRRLWEIEDAGLEWRELPQQGVLELRSSRIFLEEPIAEVALHPEPASLGILTYFVNELRAGQHRTPYSIVAALSACPTGIIDPNMSNDEIIINRWLADDLQVGTGDKLEMSYYVMGPGRNLQEKTSGFRVRRIVPLEGQAADRELMPDYPGLAESENCRDWKPGLPIDFDRIRPQDEEYWDKYRGTAKAFVTLSAGQKMWANRFGNLTAVRYPLSNNARDRITQALKNKIDSKEVGLFFQPVAERAQSSAQEATDLGTLFLSLSIFLIVAALGLTGLLFVFGTEQRQEETATLMAVGFTRQKVCRLLLGEGCALACLGSLLGVAGSVAYTRIMIYGLSTVWRSAAGGSIISFHAKGSTLLIGAGAGIITASLAIGLTLWRQKRYQLRELLAGLVEEGPLPLKSYVLKSRIGLAVAGAGFMGAATLIFFSLFGRQDCGSGTFFTAGTLLLLAALSACYTVLVRGEIPSRKFSLSFISFAERNAIRRRGRSLTVVGLLACGSFLVFAVGANRHNPLTQAQERSGGTGGFAIIAQTALPVLYDLNQETGRSKFGLSEKDLSKVNVVHLRVRDGDDASCLNLNRVQNPRLLGVPPEEFQRRGAFSFVKTLDGKAVEDPWSLLYQKGNEQMVPAITDQTTMVWALHKKLGDTLDYIDERGRPFQVRLVGSLQNSILQGSLIIAEEELVERFPSEQGYRMLLIDAPADKQKQIAALFTRAGRDIGLEITPAVRRLAELYEVENTYLAIFQLLGGLGMFLGSAALALVVLRNVMERRGELAMLRAIGFDKSKLIKLILFEHWWLLGLGLASGVVCALVAVAPALQKGGQDFPYAGLGLTLTALIISGLLWIWLAGRMALRGPLLEALRNE